MAPGPDKITQAQKGGGGEGGYFFGEGRRREHRNKAEPLPEQHLEISTTHLRKWEAPTETAVVCQTPKVGDTNKSNS